jgi:hypothetical protein
MLRLHDGVEMTTVPNGFGELREAFEQDHSPFLGDT